MRTGTLFITLAAGCAVSLPAFSASPIKTVTATALESATIVQSGTGKADSAPRYLTVAGYARGKSASYSVLRFDAGAIRNALQKQFGPNQQFHLTSVKLLLTQNPTPGATAGIINIFIANNDATPLSSLKYPYRPTGGVLPGMITGSYRFTPARRPGHVRTAAVGGRAAAGPTVDQFELMRGRSIGLLLQHMITGKKLTVVLSEIDPDVAAAWARTGEHVQPVLVISADNKPKFNRQSMQMAVPVPIFRHN